MPYRFTRGWRWPWHLGLPLLAWFLMLALAAGTGRPALRLAFCFVAGILTLTVVQGGRRWWEESAAWLRIDNAAIAWHDGTSTERRVWSEVRRVFLVEGEALYLRLQFADGTTGVVPPICLPPTAAGLVEAFETEVLSRWPQVGIYRNEHPLTGGP